jgi:thiamine pyrophosphate-dependent acetolactate synthase large subunit-like protein
MDIRRSEQYSLQRRQVAEILLQDRGDLMVIAGLGATAWDITAVGDHPLNLPLWGAMGGATLIGLGLALAQPEKRVLVMTGDGEMLMGLGGLATVAVKQPRNLAIVVIDNERYGETGMQVTHTAYDVDLTGIAAATGLPVTQTVTSEQELRTAVPLIREAPGPVFVTIKVRAEELPLALPPKDGVYLKDRFRIALLGEKTAVGA